jgi:hypothetical protein
MVSSPSSLSSPPKYKYQTQKQPIFRHHRVTAATIVTMGFEHRKSAHPEGWELRSFSRTSGRQEMGRPSSTPNPRSLSSRSQPPTSRRAASSPCHHGGQKKLHAATVASQKMTINNPNEEDSGAILFHSLVTTVGRGGDNSISSPPTPEQTRSSMAESKDDRARRDQPLQIHRSERMPGRPLNGSYGHLEGGGE